jgi:membrane-bound lytic murein transglycosylase B
MNPTKNRPHRLPLAAALLALAAPTVAEPLAQRPEVAAFVARMAEQHGFDPGELTELLDEAQLQPKIIEAMNRPAEAMPWYRYRPIFLTDSRIREGVAFWAEHRETLARAQQAHGVDPAIVTAIIGVETRYGRHTGGHRVLDALVTLGFDYPRRASFFQGELESYLLLTREEGIDPLSLEGSYAGAMGLPQFIPSSFRHYAVDFDGDGKRNLWTDPADAIGSVANYLARHGWRAGAPVVTPARLDTQAHGLTSRIERPSQRVSEWRAKGVSAAQAVAGDPPAILVELEVADGEQAQWLGFQNFYVVTRYNRSPLYAMAVHQLAEAIRERRAEAAPGGSG